VGGCGVFVYTPGVTAIFSCVIFLVSSGGRGLRDEVASFGEDDAAEDRGESDTIGCDGETLAFVAVRTVREEFAALPELSVTRKEARVAGADGEIVFDGAAGAGACRFDVVEIDNELGRALVVRLHKDAFSPQM
jgi:Holliday junction resolvase-like predicted endonuclease